MVLLGLASIGAAAGGGPGLEGLEANFGHPPDSARPWVYWIWLDGNVTSNGITADLEAMARAGIGGVLLMDVKQGTPPGPVRFGSAQWRAMFQHTCVEARRLGLQVNVNNDAGWCGSGGPWVTPELSMQKVVWSETRLSGPRQLPEPLPPPPVVAGFYRDIAVLAFPTLKGDGVPMADAAPTFTTCAATAESRTTAGGAGDKRFILPRPTPDKPAWLRVEFAAPYTARQLTLTMGLSGEQICHGILQSSDDGRTFREVRPFAAEARRMVLDFPAVTARYFRLWFRHQHPDLREVVISDLDLSPRLRLAHMEGKGCFMHLQSYPGPNQFPVRAEYPAVPAGFALARSQVLDLTDRLGKDGRLSWDAPPGDWTVLRFGHTSTGKENHPAPEGGLGLECDKLRKAGVRTVFDGFLANLVRDVKTLAPGTLVSGHVDSWEVDAQNWTENFREEFRRRRGYDLLPFLPILTGRVEDSREISERFLWDFRQTIADLLADNYAGEFRRLAKRHGLRFSLEGYDAPCDDLTYTGPADEPMAEFWTWPPFEMDYTCTEMASAAHVYGKPIAAAEAFTATATERWLGHPFAVKPYGDWAFCEGLNRLVIHRYALQPWTQPARAPGMAFGPFGLHYERTETWWEDSRPWHEYLARCQFLLRQGRYVADICYLAPQNVPQHWKVPEDARDRVGYDFDVCPPEVVLKRMSVKNGRIVLPDGMSYRVLVLPESETMTPELLRKVRALVDAGATVLGRGPLKSPSLAGYPQCDAEIERMTGELWGSGRPGAAGEHRFGKGKVVWGRKPRRWLARAGVPADFEPADPSRAQGLRFIHRSMPGGEVYFVANLRLEPAEALCDFRVQDLRPEFWWPDSGRVERAALFESAHGQTRLSLRLDPAGSVFVVFRRGVKPEPDPVVSLARNGRVLADCRRPGRGGLSAPRSAGDSAPPPLDDDSRTFTMAVWARPEADIPLPEEANTGQSAYMMERNDALFPPPGHEVYGSPDHAGAGLSLGRNGVCVFEHAPFYFPPVLVYAAPLTNWTHIAVVYSRGTPRLYLNGKFTHEGRASDYIVHSGVGVRHRRGVAPFRGALGEFRGTNRALTAAEVVQWMNETPVPDIPSPLPAAELFRTVAGDLHARVWQAGAYVAATARGEQRRFEAEGLAAPLTLAGPWELDFPHGWGAPSRLQLEHLISWSEHADPGVRHFSGTAAYRKTFAAPAEGLQPGRTVWLDLGKVCVMARVKLNGRDLGRLWKPPFRVEVTGVLKPADNTLEVEVVNLWVNRMIGDEDLPEDGARNPDGTLKEWPVWLQEGRPSPTGRYTFSTWPLWKKDEPLRESGLLGPVRLLTAEEITLGR